MEENKKFQCTGNCLECLPVQRAYCASQHSYNCMRMVQSMQESLNTMSGVVEELKTKVSAIQDNEAMVFSTYNIQAQEGDGVEE